MVLQWLANNKQVQTQIKQIFFNDIVTKMKCGDIYTKHQLMLEMKITNHQVEWLMVFLQKEQYKYSNYKIYYKPLPKKITKIIKRC
jgi:hypothetical protein